MSQSMTFVQATDGRFYKEPIFAGEDWWASFDEEGGEVVVRRFKHSSPESCRARASKVLREAGFEFRNLSHWSRCERYYPPHFNKALDSHVFSFDLTGPTPLPFRSSADTDEPGGLWDFSIYGFFSDVPTVEVVRCVIGGDIDGLIARALLKQSIYKKEQERVRAEICKKLYSQHPWLRGVTKQNWQEEIARQPEKVRLRWS
jgi:hypothetical protein